VMTGGCEVRDVKHARELALFTASDDLPEVGSHFETDPCMSPEHLESQEVHSGRPCPRVELDPGNEVAAELFWAALHEQTRPYAQELAGALTAEMDPEQRAGILRRAIAQLASERVVKLLAPSQAGL